MKLRRLTLVSTLAVAMTASAVTPLWMRDVQISPDGTSIAFTYKGDIFKVATGGGQAVRLTTQPSYESNPVWSPDGKQIAFASDRNGGRDIYIMSADGGKATRLTYNSAREIPQAFTPDGKYVVFSASIQDPAQSAMFPTGTLPELYKVPAGGGRTTQILGTPALNISYLDKGGSFVYQDAKGMEDTFRKHHTSSVTRDIWRYNASDGKHKNLTNRGGEDLNPVVGTDKKTIYFLSERDGGTMNVYSMPLTAPEKVTQITDFKTHPVRFLSQGADGTLAYTWNGEIYTSKPGQQPTKVAIDVVVDDENPIERLNVGRAGGGAVSRNGKQLAFVNRGEVFVTSVEYPSTKQITHTAAGESDVIWGKDDRELIYVSERDGNYNLYRATIARKDDPNFSNATLINEELILPVDGIDRTRPKLSPDGKTLAFVQDRNKLAVMDMATKKVRLLSEKPLQTHRSKGFNVEWSPDSRWLLLEYSNPSQDPYSDIAIIDAESGQLHMLTRTGYFDGSPRWALDGNAILFASERYGMRAHASWGSQYDAMLLFLNRDAYDKFRLSPEDYDLLKEVEKAQKKKDKPQADAKKDGDKKDAKKGDKKDSKKDDKKDGEKKDDKPAVKPIKIDFDGIEDRIVRLTPNSSNLGDAIISKDGEKLYYLTSFEKGYDLWEKNLRKGDVKMVQKLGAGGMDMQMDDDGNIYLIGSQSKKFDVKSQKLKNIDVSARMDLDPAAEREYMLRYVYNEEKERFYHPGMHGVDWDAMYADYARFLPHINNNYDFADLLSEILGELNVSHTGGRYRAAGAKETTASLGLLFDWSYAGPGLKVAEVLEHGPFDHADSKMSAGAIITEINGQALTADTDPSVLLNNISRKKTLVSFRPAKGGAEVEEVVLPVASVGGLLYDRWVKQREADVDKWSNGRLGYVHIQSMDDASYRKVYAQVLGKYKDREGIVIDTRWNGGGRLHEDIEVLFSGDKYLTQEIHGEESSIMPSRRWTKPSIMIICEANYSNAHGTPWVYKHEGLGRLVGMPVPGTMTSVNWVTMQDPSLVFGIPVTGFRTAEGNYLENSQLEPDIKVANSPETVVKGIDTQLKVAVDALLDELKKK